MTFKLELRDSEGILKAQIPYEAATKLTNISESGDWRIANYKEPKGPTDQFVFKASAVYDIRIGFNLIRVYIWPGDKLDVVNLEE